MAGFTLLEVMMAMAIFVIGFTMVMTLFPAALLLQKRTVDEVRSRHAERNAQALLQARPFDHNTLWPLMDAAYSFWQTDQQVYPLPPAMLALWTIEDRSYPVDIADPFARRFYWVPLIRDKNPTPGTTSSECDWETFVFVLRRGEGLSYPKPVTPMYWANQSDPDAIPGVWRVDLAGSTNNTVSFNNDDGFGRPLVRIGDWILDSNGVIYRVTDVDLTAIPDNVTLDGKVIPTGNPGAPTHIWIGRPSTNGGPSPTHRIFVVPNAVQ